MGPQDLVSLDLAFGRSLVHVEVPSSNLMAVLDPVECVDECDEATILRDALARPIGTPRLRDLARPGQRVVIVTSDGTRPCPSDRLLPSVLDELNAAGVPDADITVVMALGLHRAMTPAEIEEQVGAAALRRVTVVNHDPRDVVALGTTTAGTPIEIFRRVVQADLRVCLGNLEFHYFAGYSGGAKAIFPGCASENAVCRNHSLMVRPEAAAGRIDDNPVRADLEQAASRVGIDFILNVIVDGSHRIVGAVAGEPTLAHRAGCDLVSRRGKMSIPRLADIVLVSAGGHPTDINLYQAQKALDNAVCAVRPGGVILLVAECPEGLGNRTFAEWMTSARTPAEILERLRREFVLGGHKAAAIARAAMQAHLLFVAPPLASYSLPGIEHSPTVSAALETAFERVGRDAQIVVMPRGGSVLPDARA